MRSLPFTIENLNGGFMKLEGKRQNLSEIFPARILQNGC